MKTRQKAHVWHHGQIFYFVAALLVFGITARIKADDAENETGKADLVIVPLLPRSLAIAEAPGFSPSALYQQLAGYTQGRPGFNGFNQGPGVYLTKARPPSLAFADGGSMHSIIYVNSGTGQPFQTEFKAQRFQDGVVHWIQHQGGVPDIESSLIKYMPLTPGQSRSLITDLNNIPSGLGSGSMGDGYAYPQRITPLFRRDPLSNVPDIYNCHQYSTEVMMRGSTYQPKTVPLPDRSINMLSKAALAVDVASLGGGLMGAVAKDTNNTRERNGQMASPTVSYWGAFGDSISDNIDAWTSVPFRGIEQFFRDRAIREQIARDQGFHAINAKSVEAAFQKKYGYSSTNRLVPRENDCSK